MQRPGIPAYGVAYLRRVVTDGMTDTVQVVRPAVPVYDQATGYATGVSTAEPGYLGPAHVRTTNQTAPVTVGDTVLPMAVVEVSLPFAADPLPRNEDHLVIQAVGALGDKSLEGETLRIINVSGGGTGATTRTLTCVFEQANPFDTSA